MNTLTQKFVKNTLFAIIICACVMPDSFSMPRGGRHKKKKPKVAMVDSRATGDPVVGTPRVAGKEEGKQAEEHVVMHSKGRKPLDKESEQEPMPFVLEPSQGLDLSGGAGPAEVSACDSEAVTQVTETEEAKHSDCSKGKRIRKRRGKGKKVVNSEKREKLEDLAVCMLFLERLICSTYCVNACEKLLKDYINKECLLKQGDEDDFVYIEAQAILYYFEFKKYSNIDVCSVIDKRNALIVRLKEKDNNERQTIDLWLYGGLLENYRNRVCKCDINSQRLENLIKPFSDIYPDSSCLGKIEGCSDTLMLLAMIFPDFDITRYFSLNSFYNKFVKIFFYPCKEAKELMNEINLLDTKNTELKTQIYDKCQEINGLCGRFKVLRDLIVQLDTNLIVRCDARVSRSEDVSQLLKKQYSRDFKALNDMLCCVLFFSKREINIVRDFYIEKLKNFITKAFLDIYKNTFMCIEAEAVNYYIHVIETEQLKLPDGETLGLKESLTRSLEVIGIKQNSEKHLVITLLLYAGYFTKTLIKNGINGNTLAATYATSIIDIAKLLIGIQDKELTISHLIIDSIYSGDAKFVKIEAVFENIVNDFNEANSIRGRLKKDFNESKRLNEDLQKNFSELNERKVIVDSTIRSLREAKIAELENLRKAKEAREAKNEKATLVLDSDYKSSEQEKKEKLQNHRENEARRALEKAANESRRALEKAEEESRRALEKAANEAGDAFAIESSDGEDSSGASGSTGCVGNTYEFALKRRDGSTYKFCFEFKGNLYGKTHGTIKTDELLRSDAFNLRRNILGAFGINVAIETGKGSHNHIDFDVGSEVSDEYRFIFKQLWYQIAKTFDARTLVSGAENYASNVNKLLNVLDALIKFAQEYDFLNYE